MEGQLRPGLRADDDEEEVVMVVVLELTVVLEEDVEEDEVVAGADGVCTSLAESTLRGIFSTLTAGVRILSGWSILKVAKGDLRGMPGSFSLAGLRSFGLEEEDAEDEDKLDPAVEGLLRIPPPAMTVPPELRPGPSPLPLLRFLPDTGKGKVVAGLLAELCLLS